MPKAISEAKDGISQAILDILSILETPSEAYAWVELLTIFIYLLEFILE